MSFDENKDIDYSLESILAEYKGSAFIQGQSRMSKDELEKQARKIIEEYTGVTEKPGRAPEPPVFTEPIDEEEVKEYTPRQSSVPRNEVPDGETRTAPEKKPRRGEVVKKEIDESEKVEEKNAKRGSERGIREVEDKRQRISEVEEKQSRMFSHRELTEDEQEFFGVGKYSRSEPEEEVREEVEKTIEEEKQRRDKKRSRRKEKAEKPSGRPEAGAAQQELSAVDAMRVYGSGIESIRVRLIPLFLLFLVMVYVTFALDMGWVLPAILSQPAAASLFLGIGLLVAVILAADVFVTGLVNLFRLKFGGETLITASCILALVDCGLQFASEPMRIGTPFCAVAAGSLLFGLWGLLKGRKAYRMTFKIASQTKVPTVVSAEWERVDEGSVITKNLGSASGFAAKSVQKDLTENVYGWLTPILIAVSLVLAGLCAHVSGENYMFVHCASAMCAVSASFGLLLSFNQPFFLAAKKLHDHGAAIAGWRGACDMKRAVGMVVRDLDLFPENTMTFNGVKMLAPLSAERIVSYTGSLVIASGAGTSKLFAELMREYASSLYRVDEFSCYESGGIGATINVSRVLVGSAAFMNLMGIHMPPNLDIKSAVFSAINEELAGVFIINYMPSDSVQNALMTMRNHHIAPIFAIRDFNVTPALIRGKFKIPLDEGSFTSFAARYELSQNNGSAADAPAAIMSREGINHYAETVRCGRRMAFATRLTLWLTALSAIIGILLMVMMFSGGAVGAASAANTLSYMLMWALASYILATF